MRGLVGVGRSFRCTTRRRYRGRAVIFGHRRAGRLLRGNYEAAKGGCAPHPDGVEAVSRPTERPCAHEGAGDLRRRNLFEPVRMAEAGFGYTSTGAGTVPAGGSGMSAHDWS